MVNSKHYRTTYFPALSGLRAVAASMIFFSHYAVRLPASLAGLEHLFREMHTGVVIFFVLSGFLLGYRYANGFSFSWSWARRFYWSRFVRIFPLYWLVLAIIFSYRASSSLGWWLSVTLAKGFFADFKFYGVAPAWALTVELTFYVFLPLILGWRRRIGLWWQAVLFLGVGVVFLKTIGGWHGFMGSSTFVLVYTFFGRAFEFLLGIWLGLVVLDKKTAAGSGGKKTVAGVVITAAGIVALSLLQKPELGGVGLLHPVGIVVNNYGVAIGVALLIWGLVTEKTVVSWFLSLPWMDALGKASYVFFLIHFTLIARVIDGYVGNHYWWRFAAVWGISYLAYRFIEVPLNRLFLPRKEKKTSR